MTQTISFLLYDLLTKSLLTGSHLKMLYLVLYLAYKQEQNGRLFSSLSFNFTVETYYFSSSHQNITFV